MLLILPTIPSGPALGQMGSSRSHTRRQEMTPAAPVTPREPVKISHFTEAWRAPLDAPTSGALVASRNQLMVATTNGSVVALAGYDGHLLWKRDLGDRPLGGPAPLGSGIAQAGVSGRIVAWSQAGDSLWTADLKENVAHPPAGSREELFVPLVSAKLVSLGTDGRERWRVDLDSPPSTPPAACRGFVAIGTEGGAIQAFARGTGTALWTARTGSPVSSPLLCYRGAIYFGTADAHLWALKYSGARMWKYPSGARCAARPFALDGKVYYLSFDDYLYSLNSRSGHLILRVRLSHRLTDEVLVGGDRIYLSPYTSARLVALSLPDLVKAGEYHLELEGDWFTTPPLRMDEIVYIAYGRDEGRILALRETIEEAGKDSS